MLKTQSVSVVLGNGDGTFAPQRSFSVNPPVYALALADVNGDGKPDLATSSYYDPGISVFLGNGDGTFGPQKSYASGGGDRSVTVADLNGDGKPDLLAKGMVLGNGDGTFRPSPSSLVGAALAEDRFNGFLRPDVRRRANDSRKPRSCRPG